MMDARIEAVRCLLLRLPLPQPIDGPFGRLSARPNLIAVIETSAGVRGIGEIWANFPPWGPAERIAIVCDSPERWRGSLATVFEPLEIPYSVEYGRRLGDTDLGRAALSLLRYAWLGGGRGDPEVKKVLHQAMKELKAAIAHPGTHYRRHDK